MLFEIVGDIVCFIKWAMNFWILINLEFMWPLVTFRLIRCVDCVHFTPGVILNLIVRWWCGSLACVVEVVGMMLCGGEEVAWLVDGPGGEKKAMLVPLVFCVLWKNSASSDELSENSRSVVSPYRLGYFLSLEQCRLGFSVVCAVGVITFGVLTVATSRPASVSR